MKKVLTANRLSDGIAVWLDANGRWTDRIETALVARHDNAVTGLEQAGKSAFNRNVVVDVALIDVEETHPFLWLQSLEDSAVSFLLVNPKLFVNDYKIEVNSKELFELEIDEVDDVETYVVVTIQNDPPEMSLNLQGPILINNANNLGKQLVLVNSSYEVRHKININAETEETTTETIEEPALV